MKMQKPLSFYKSRIAERLNMLSANRLTQIDYPAISPAKIPGNAMWYRETML
jgi:hypothetical protein